MLAQQSDDKENVHPGRPNSSSCKNSLDATAAAETGEERASASKEEAMTRESKRAFNTHIKAAKSAEAGGDTEDALEQYQAARTRLVECGVGVNDKLERKIAALGKQVAKLRAKQERRQARLAKRRSKFARCAEGSSFYQHRETSDYHLLPEDGPGELIIPGGVFERLYGYQRTCVEWLWSLHGTGMGGILGDDMGLGKTVQVGTYINGLFYSGLIKRVLILAPVSVIPNWQNELKIWCSDIPCHVFHGSSKKKRQAALDCVLDDGGICLTSYGLAKNSVRALSRFPAKKHNLCDDDNDDDSDDDDDAWDYVILDEGHVIKCPDIQLSRQVRLIPAHQRLILSGTPIQNNLQELWSLFDFVCEGRLLGDRKTFKVEFASKILEGSDKNATEKQKQVSLTTAENLRRLIAPHFLRREKKDIVQTSDKHNNGDDDADDDGDNGSADARSNADSGAEEAAPRSDGVDARTGSGGGPDLSVQKNDLTVWLPLCKAQLGLYRAFLDSAEAKASLNKTRSPLAAMTVLKKICDHPRLLTEDMKTVKSLAQILPASFTFDAESLIAESSKLRVLAALLEDHREHGHRTLIFSQSKKMLDIVEIVLRSRKLSMLRIDGDVVAMAERQKRIDIFNENDSIDCFLLTTQTGGLGISLTGADRVVIIDPAWNPAVDSQAVDRSYRIGQQRDVVIYRFITCSTIEEVIYRKQVFKGGLLRTATSSKVGNQQRYFSRKELREVFSLHDPNLSHTQRLLARLHAGQRKTYQELDDHLNFVHTLGIYGVSDHDVLFSRDGQAIEIPEEVLEEVKQSTERLLASATPAPEPSARKKARRAAMQSNPENSDDNPQPCFDAVAEDEDDNNLDDDDDFDNHAEFGGEEQREQASPGGETGYQDSVGVAVEKRRDAWVDETHQPREGEPSPQQLIVQSNLPDQPGHERGNDIGEDEDDDKDKVKDVDEDDDDDDVEEDEEDEEFFSAVEHVAELDSPSNRLRHDDRRAVCELHGDLTLMVGGRRFHANVLQCRCYLSPSQRDEYNTMLRRMDQAINEDTSPRDALELAIRALDICSDDSQLHLKVLSLMHETS